MHEISLQFQQSAAIGKALLATMIISTRILNIARQLNDVTTNFIIDVFPAQIYWQIRFNAINKARM